MVDIEKTMEEVGLIDLKLYDPSIHVELAYAGVNNFMKQKMYENNRAFVPIEVAKALSQAQVEFKKLTYSLKVLDAYRPHSVQEKFWEKFPKPSFLAQPLRNGEKLVSGSKHSRGAALDVTLVDEAGNELLMPTPFDEFSERAGRRFGSLTEPTKGNVMTLERIMHENQFVGLPAEWWHFDYVNWTEYPLLDVPI